MQKDCQLVSIWFGFRVWKSSCPGLGLSPCCKTLSAVRVVRHCSWLPRLVMDAPCLEMVKAKLGRVLNNLV